MKKRDKIKKLYQEHINQAEKKQEEEVPYIYSTPPSKIKNYILQEFSAPKKPSINQYYSAPILRPSKESKESCEELEFIDVVQTIKKINKFLDGLN